MRKVLYVIFVSMILTWAVPQISEGNTVMLFDAPTIDELVNKGITVSESAKYTVWAWARLHAMEVMAREGEAPLSL